MHPKFLQAWTALHSHAVIAPGLAVSVPGVSGARQNMAWAQHRSIVCMLIAAETILTFFISLVTINLSNF